MSKKNVNNLKVSLRILFLVFMSQPITGCTFDTFDMYRDSVHELVQDPSTRVMKGNEGDVNDLSGCQYLMELGQWRKDNDKRWGISWDRGNVWMDGRIEHHKTFGLDIKSDLSPKILSNKSLHPIYIGPWHFYPTIQKSIRFFAYTGIGGGDIQYHYESQTEENKNIPEKKFSLPSKAKDGSPAIPPDRFDLCVVKWTARFGYNAIAEVKSKNPFSKNYLVPTGRVIDSETGKIIEAKE